MPTESALRAILATMDALISEGASVPVEPAGAPVGARMSPGEVSLAEPSILARWRRQLDSAVDGRSAGG